MRISDWSSDVCSSDLGTAIGLAASDAWVKERDPVKIGTTHIHHHGRISIAPSAYPSPQTHICHPERSAGSASSPGKAAPSLRSGRPGRRRMNQLMTPSTGCSDLGRTTRKKREGQYE